MTWQQYKYRLRTASQREAMSHGLIPCPNCGGDIEHKSFHCQMCGGMGQAPAPPGPSGRPRYQSEVCPMCHGSGTGETWYQCAGCGKQWDDTDSTAKQLLPAGVPCPKCGEDMYFRDGASLGGMWPNGAWECSNQRCWHMIRPEDMAPDTYQDPDAPGDFTLPEGFP